MDRRHQLLSRQHPPTSSISNFGGRRDTRCSMAASCTVQRRVYSSRRKKRCWEKLVGCDRSWTLLLLYIYPTLCIIVMLKILSINVRMNIVLTAWFFISVIHKTWWAEANAQRYGGPSSSIAATRSNDSQPAIAWREDIVCRTQLL